MFYAPEILSYKNKTELSLVYYMSTAKNPKRFARKDVVELNVESIINQMKNPKVPFALRLYSYLLKGIVRIWVMKVDFYKGKVQSLLSKSMSRPKNNALRKREISSLSNEINLRIIEDFISEVEDLSTNTEINLIRPNGNTLRFGAIPDGFNIDGLCSAYDGFNADGLSMAQDGFDVDGFAESINSNIPSNASRRVSSMKIDRKIEMKPDEVYAKKIKTSTFEVPSLIDCHAIQLFERTMCKSKADANQSYNAGIGFDFDTVSIEDPRVSSSLSQERSIERERPAVSQNELQALWFYNLLVSATKGEVRLVQSEPFSEIVIERPSN
ncbi:uncharacterized protein VICG_00967 [Vittaforma corneae ATCC 50505]|uniref:Rad21/Rec8-like protein N-terminal domain-containing protein n=1 Tax=Vittaforma corneae (strain ATCC 50505) TaxID=993615 RepID=L2GN75_VITCO|nr:uncharacterized protein VICG_00967 [Vittaforma corneae ATCC 50505]ELA41950.1 hypothetical protein VICG_00967 [Vittaforma corneae ATCC 50505]